MLKLDSFNAGKIPGTKNKTTELNCYTQQILAI